MHKFIRICLINQFTQKTHIDSSSLKTGIVHFGISGVNEFEVLSTCYPQANSWVAHCKFRVLRSLWALHAHLLKMMNQIDSFPLKSGSDFSKQKCRLRLKLTFSPYVSYMKNSDYTEFFLCLEKSDPDKIQ